MQSVGHSCYPFDAIFVIKKTKMANNIIDKKDPTAVLSTATLRYNFCE